MNALQTPPLPTLRQLVKATSIALVAAGIILTTAVLPAEYGIDPTGLGNAMGLTALKVESAETKAVPVAAAPALAGSMPTTPTTVQSDNATLSKSDTPFRSDDMALTLQPNEGAEIKAVMRKGEQFVFHWTAGDGKVNVDMHGERPDAGDKFTSYWKAQQQSSAQGTFVAPFDGTHGWYWRNRGDKPVTVKVRVSGFHDKLYKPT